MDTCPRPFKGVILCATGIEDKPSLFKEALELGATSTNAFTDRVTHLVAEQRGGAKYNCALERKIPILKPSWVRESFLIWRQGDDVDLEESIEKHRLPIFSGVILCPSGINDITRRTQINKMLTKHGGMYMKNLERPVKVTHLLCSGDEDTDKMRYAEKFNDRGEANVHLVWEEWFWDSLEFGGRFDEDKYQVRRPRPERKSLPETASPPPPSSSAVHSDQPENPAPAPLKPQETSFYDDTEEELASVQRLPAATLQLWGSLLGRRGYEISNGELIKSPSKAPRPPIAPPPASPERGNGSLISQFRRSNSFAPVRSDRPASALPKPFRRTRTVSAMNHGNDDAGSFMASARQNNGESSKSAISGIFSGLKFVALGEAKSPSVRTAIEDNGGRMALDADDENVDFIIVRLVSGSKLYREEPEESQRLKYRTECWLERCVFSEAVCPRDEHVTFSPLAVQPPVAGAEKINLSFSGLDQAEATWVTRLLRALGINLEQFFSRRSSHLLCPAATGPKFDKACQWGTPVVTMEWLTTIATAGHIPATSGFLVPAYQDSIRGRRPEGPMEVDTDAKGKGKAVDKGKGKILVEDSGPQTIPSGPEGLSGPLAQSTQWRRPDPSTPSRKSHLEVFPFGQPTALLGGPSKLDKAAVTPTRTMSVPVIQTTPHHHNTQPKAPTAPAAQPARHPTPREIERERKQARIPSSRSPSPLKVPRHAQTRIPTESPTRIPMDVAKELEDNITTLLGKRQQPGEEQPSNNARPGKRQRPQRPTKVQSRQSSDAQLSDIPAIPMPAYDDSLNPFEPLDELSVAENSIRVTYEDPKQKEETKRLMNLLNVGSKVDAGLSEVAEGRKGSLRTRKSSRIAGF
ncbi:hypothetical protein DXG03_004088 [Asterophora parasitica]|uniref:BRCT domain-containing protein n=1 Tax=Asterophora parasitica TaxID=117018 RepID=A0A9P7KAA1_9AGAR|nr:hypothetical protein DXG03_004088 [Asterophora parasitica]